MNDRKLGEKVCDVLWGNDWRASRDNIWAIDAYYDDYLNSLTKMQRKELKLKTFYHSVHAEKDHIQLCRIGSLARHRKLNDEHLTPQQKLKLAALYTTIPTPEESKEARQQQFYDQVTLGMQLITLLTYRTVSFDSQEHLPFRNRHRDLVHPKFGTGYIQTYTDRRNKPETNMDSFRRNHLPIFSLHASGGPIAYRKVARLFLAQNEKELQQLLRLTEPMQMLKLAAAHAFYKENGSLDEKLLPATATS